MGGIPLACASTPASTWPSASLSTSAVRWPIRTMCGLSGSGTGPPGVAGPSSWTVGTPAIRSLPPCARPRFRGCVRATPRRGSPSPPPGPNHGDEVIADQTITLGRPHTRTGAVVRDVRLVTSRKARGEPRCVVTDRVDLPATETVTRCRQRWRIERFFRWLKHPLGVLPPLGHRPRAVLLTRSLAAMLAVLAILLAADRPRHLSDIAWVRMLGQTLFLILLRGGSCASICPGGLPVERSSTLRRF